MRHQEVDNYLIAILPTYETACKTEKGKLLDHAQLVTKRSRKHLIKKLRELKANKGSLSSNKYSLLKYHYQVFRRIHGSGRVVALLMLIRYVFYYFCKDH